MTICYDLFSQKEKPQNFTEYLTRPQFSDNEFRLNTHDESFAMSAWRHSVGRVSAVASSVIVALGVTLQLCKLGVMAAICGITGGLSGRIVKALDWDQIKSEFTMLPSNLSAVTSWYFESILTPDPEYPAFWTSPYISYTVFTGKELIALPPSY